MARGIRLPIRDSVGRLVLLGGDDYIQQLVANGLGDGDSENPFQSVGLGEFMIFGINDAMSEGQIRDRVVNTFEVLEQDQLAKVDAEDITFEKYRGPNGAELRMTLTYTNMETQERPEFEVPIPPGS